MPFQNASSQDQFYKLIILEHSNEFWNLHKSQGMDVDSSSAEVKSLIFSLLSKDANIRPSLNEILSHKWMTETHAFGPNPIFAALKHRLSHAA